MAFKVERTKVALGIALISTVLGCAPSEEPSRLFEDVTIGSGIGNRTGMTYGAAWGDFDADGQPDLYVTNHLDPARLYHNEGGGRFTDVTAEWFIGGLPDADKHGAAWADFDNDGRADLVQITGAGRGIGAEPKYLFRNTGEGFEDVAGQLEVANAEGRTRMPLWLDFNRDGQLDLFHGAERRFDDIKPPFLFIQQDNGFHPDTESLKFADRSVPFCILAVLNNDAVPELVCRVAADNLTAQVFDVASLPPRELKLLPVSAFDDITAGDFDNDGRFDLFLARTNPAGPVALGRPGSNALVADVVVKAAEDAQSAGFKFRSSGELTFRVESAWPHRALAPENVFLGGQGAHPEDLSFSLSPETAEITGMPQGRTDSATTIRVGLERPDIWRVEVLPAEPGGKIKKHQVAIKVIGSEPITDREAMGSALQEEAAPFRLFMNRGGRTLVEESNDRGVNGYLVAGVNVVSGDFDNDMDLDLFVVASGLVGNRPNLLLRNRGDGHFEADPTGGGASGTLGSVGDSVTTVDFDGDGFLDLFIANGGSMGRSLGLPSEAGGYRLYRNLGNDNHWLEIDLEGTHSNRDGIGARVDVTAGGVTQARLQDGGVHRRGQNHARLHFGLGPNTEVETLQIHWPSGTVQELRGIKADQALKVTEPSV